MEGAPLKVEDTPDQNPETKASKKKEKSKERPPAQAKELGAILVEAKPEAKAEAGADEERRSFLSFFEKDEEAKAEGPPEEAEPLAPEMAEATTEAGLEPESEPVSAEEAPTDSIGDTEIPVVESQLVEVIREVEAERAAEPDSDPAVEYFRDLVRAGEGSEAAYETVMAELGVEEDELPALEEEPTAEELPEPPEAAPAEGFEEELIIDHSQAAEAEPETDGSVPSGAGTGARPPTPPSPPTPPTARGPAGPGGRPPAGGGPVGFNPNFQPVPQPAAANRQPQPPPGPEYHRAHPAAMALVGGIIGYLIGRRRGRIKTEKRLLPIQKKLEKQVEDMQWQLQAKERTIRRVAAEKVAQKGPVLVEAIQQKLVERKLAEEPAKPETTPPEPVRRRAPEARQLHVEQEAHGRIGQVLVAAEALPASRRPETAKPKAEKPAKAELPPGKRVETLNRAELLAISEKIEVGGSTLRQIYETHLIGERGLRRLITEHLRGGDLKKALHEEIIEREIDFERDPAMRDMAPDHHDNGPTPAGGGQATLNTLIERAAGQVDGEEEAAFFRARANYEASQREQHKQQRRVIDISLAALVASLMALVVYLLISRG